MPQSQRIGNSRRIDELTTKERRFCALRVRGYSQTQAWRDAFDKPRVKANSASSRASELSKRPRVMAYLKTLYREAKKIDLISHSEWLASALDDLNAAREAENWTAVSSLQRIVAQGIGSLSETLNIADARMSDEQLLDRLAGQDPILAEALRTRLKSRDTFH